MKLYQLAVAAIALAILGGCSTYATNRYTISADNVVAMKNITDAEINVGAFSASKPGQTSIMCRGVGPIKTPDGETFENFVRNSLISEMKLAEIFEPASDTVLTGNLNSIDFNSASGTWNLSLTVTSSNGQAITIDDSYDYTSSWYGETACNQTAQALMPAVQNVITKLVQHESFPALLK